MGADAMTDHDNNALPELLPCPFCGKQAAQLSDTVEIGVTNAQFMHTVVCNVNRNGCGATSGYDWEADEAIAAWNRRAAGPEEAVDIMSANYAAGFKDGMRFEADNQLLERADIAERPAMAPDAGDWYWLEDGDLFHSQASMNGHHFGRYYRDDGRGWEDVSKAEKLTRPTAPAGNGGE